MNSKSFYGSIRASLFLGVISPAQFAGIEAIIAEYNLRCINDPRKLAYILATVFHETAKTFQPIAEYGKGAGHDYGKKLKMSRIPYTTPDQIYYGRGYSQTTWFENYAQFGRLLKIDLLNNPDLLLTVDVSVKVLFEGMVKGMFTGKSLGTYFTDSLTDPINARKIINGLDQANTIKTYYDRFYGGLILQ